MTLGRSPLGIFCSRGTPPREVPRVCRYLRQFLHTTAHLEFPTRDSMHTCTSAWLEAQNHFLKENMEGTHFSKPKSVSEIQFPKLKPISQIIRPSSSGCAPSRKTTKCGGRGVRGPPTSTASPGWRPRFPVRLPNRGEYL